MRNHNGRLITGNVPEEYVGGPSGSLRALVDGGINLRRWVRANACDTLTRKALTTVLRMLDSAPLALVARLQELFGLCVQSYRGGHARIALIEGHPVLWVSLDRENEQRPVLAYVCQGALRPWYGVRLSVYEATRMGLLPQGSLGTWGGPDTLYPALMSETEAIEFAAALSVLHLAQEAGLIETRMNVLNRYGQVDFTATPMISWNSADETSFRKELVQELPLEGLDAAEATQVERDTIRSNAWMTMLLGMGSETLHPIDEESGTVLAHLPGSDGRGTEDFDVGTYTVDYEGVSPLAPPTRREYARALRPTLSWAWDVEQACIFYKGGQRYLKFPRTTFDGQKIIVPVRKFLRGRADPKVWNTRCAPDHIRHDHRRFGETEFDGMIRALLEEGRFMGQLVARDRGRWARRRVMKGAELEQLRASTPKEMWQSYRLIDDGDAVLIGRSREVECYSCKRLLGKQAPERAVWVARPHADVCTSCGNEFWQVQLHAYLEAKYFPYLTLEDNVTHLRVTVWGRVVADYMRHHGTGEVFTGLPWHEIDTQHVPTSQEVELKERIAKAALRPTTTLS